MDDDRMKRAIRTAKIVEAIRRVEIEVEHPNTSSWMMRTHVSHRDANRIASRIEEILDGEDI